MGLFRDRRKSQLPEAYTGVNRPPTGSDMPNRNALAAANTIGKLFQGSTGSTINMNQSSLSRSNSLQTNKSSLNYNNQLRNISAASSTSPPPPAVKYIPKKVSRANSLSASSSKSSQQFFVKHQNKRASTSSLPMEGYYSPSHSLTSTSKSKQSLLQKQRNKSVSSLTANNTRQNEELTKPRMVRKTVPTPYGLKTIEVPAEEYERTQSLSRTSSLMSASKIYTPKHSSFTVSSINNRTKLQKKIKRTKDDLEMANRSANSSFAPSYDDDDDGDSITNFLQLPPSLGNINKPRKRVSFTEDSPDNSIIGSSIAEFPDEEAGEAVPSIAASSPSFFKSTPQTSPLKKVFTQDTITLEAEPEVGELKQDDIQPIIIPEVAEPTSSAVDEKLIETPLKVEVDEKPIETPVETPAKSQVDEKPIATPVETPAKSQVDALPQDTNPSQIEEPKTVIEVNDTVVDESQLPPPATSKITQSEAISNGTQSPVGFLKPASKITPQPKPANSTTPIAKQPANVVAATKDVKPHQPIMKQHPASVKPSSKQSTVIDNNNNNSQQNLASRRKSKRHSTPVSIPSAHAFEKADYLSGYNNGHNGDASAAKKKLHRQSLPPGNSFAQTMRSEKSLNRNNSTKVQRSNSTMASRSFRIDATEVNNGPGRSSSVMGNRSFRSNANNTPVAPSSSSPPPQFQAPPSSFLQAKPPRPKSDIGGFRSLRPPPTTVSSAPPKPTFNSIAPPPLKGLETKSSFEKLRPTESNKAFKRLSMRDYPGSPSSTPSESISMSSPSMNGASNLGIFKSRFDDSDDEDSGAPSSSRKFARHSFRRQENPAASLPKVQERVVSGSTIGSTASLANGNNNNNNNNNSASSTSRGTSKLFGFARHHKPETPTLVKKSAVPDIITNQTLSTPVKHDEPDVLKTPSSSINSDKLFEQHLNESKKHFLFSQFENSYSAHHISKNTQSQTANGDGGFASINNDGGVELEKPKKKKKGKLRKLFGM
ncbi:hypothetical protein DASC09_056490 [Saccharomycopsis crataegensis]|uniref:Eisosome protein SEG1 n=1 Tax=Saccharomycopsis crataegensis TaxID=43959 RepID=A0AAV5QUP1_9ASCO|nr:hypothetical protein DASC09_056490 [Saccharomycopsis crataegensis]